MALSRQHVTAAARPLSVEEIVKEAESFEFAPGRSLKNWLRTAQMLFTQAAICEQDGDIQMAYLYLYRHAQLILGKLLHHPQFKDPKFKAELAQAQNTVKENLPKLEQWRPRLNQEHQRYAKAMEKRNAEKQRIQKERMQDEKEQRAKDRIWRGSISSEDGAYDERSETLDANDYRHLAVDIAQRGLQRRDLTRQSTRQAGISPTTVAARRKGFVADPDFDHEDPLSASRHGLDKASDGIREAGQHLFQSSRHLSTRSHTEQRTSNASTYSYPLVPAREGMMDWRSPEPPQLQPFPPAPPAKDPPRNNRTTTAPPIPPRPNHTDQPPTPSKDALPSNFTFKSTAFTEQGSPLRPVYLPPSLRTTFLNLAHANTLRNLESCGILCGTLISNALFINHLIIPDQISTSDTCDTTEEGDNALFDFCDGHDLLVCGWIHTHPSQSCFLSSRDLHTSSGYQVMLPEAIAIVCAPKHNPDWGVFRLTDPPGLGHVLDCRQQSTFHPHAEKNLYTDAWRPGHVIEGPGLPFEVIDLRK